MAAWIVFETVCLKFDETQCQQKLRWIIQSLTAVEPLFSLPSCLREPRSGLLYPFPFPCPLALTAGKVYPPADWTCGPLRPQAPR